MSSDMELESVELYNFRSHEHRVITPRRHGVTALHGHNGAGKSSVVDAFVWALYGERPQGVRRNGDLVRHGVKPSSLTPSKVVVTMVVDEKRYRIERRFVSASSVEGDIWVDDGGDWDHVAGSAVTALNEAVRRVIGMDKAGFMSAVVVRQKQVDELLITSKEKRRDVIERLTGVDVVSDALHQANVQAKEATTLYRACCDTECDTTALDHELADGRQAMSDAKDALHDYRSQHDVLCAREKEAEQRLTQAEKIMVAVTQCRTRIDASQQRCRHLEKELRECQSCSASCRADIDALGETPTENVDTVTARISAHENTLVSIERECAVAESRVAQAHKVLEECRSLDVSDSDALHHTIDDVTRRIDEHMRLCDEAQSEVASCQARVKTLNHAIEAITSGGGTCPTCLQTVDDADAAIAHLEDEKKDIIAQGRAAHASGRQAHSDVDDLRETLKKAQYAADVVARGVEAQHVIDDETDHIRSLHQRIREMKNSIASDKQCADQMLRCDMLNQKLADALSREQQCRSQLRDEETQQRHDAATIDECDNVTDGMVEKAREEASGLRKRATEMAVTIAHCEGDIKAAYERCRSLETTIQDKQQAAQRIEQARTAMTTAVTTRDVLAEFHQERVRQSTPLISSYASTVLSQFTDGALSQLVIDEDYIAHVVLDDGTLRSVSQLSGGEMSAVAMSLRVAISMLLGGVTGTLLVLDEVFVSQDHARAEAMLMTIRDVCQGQVIIIAHDDTVEDIADETIQLP